MKNRNSIKKCWRVRSSVRYKARTKLNHFSCTTKSKYLQVWNDRFTKYYTQNCFKPSGVTRGGRPWLLFNFFLLKKWMDHIGARRGDHGAMAPPLALALLWIPIRVVKISDTGVSFFDKKNVAKVSVFLVKTQKIRWRLGALLPDPLSLRRLGFRPQTLACGLLLPNPECVTDLSTLLGFLLC